MCSFKISMPTDASLDRCRRSQNALGAPSVFRSVPFCQRSHPSARICVHSFNFLSDISEETCALVQSPSSREHQKQGVCHTMALAFTLKSISWQKRRIMEIQIFHHAKIYSSKKSSKGNQNPSRYHNSMTNFKFQHKPKNHLSKILL